MKEVISTVDILEQSLMADLVLTALPHKYQASSLCKTFALDVLSDQKDVPPDSHVG